MVVEPFVKVRFPIVEEGVLNSEDDARPPLMTVKTGLVPATTLKRDPAREVEVPIVSDEEEKRKTVLEARWRFMKSPRKVEEARFAPRRVPRAEPPRMGWALHWIRDWVVVAIGIPLMMKAAEEDVLFPERVKMPEPVAFVNVRFVIVELFA